MPYAAVTCFMLEPTGEWVHTAYAECPASHEHRFDLGEGQSSDSRPDFHGIAWPTACPTCGVAMDYDEEAWRSTSSSQRYRRVDTGEIKLGVTAFGPGAMFDNEHGRKGPDGRSLAVILPDERTWHIDSRAGNCGRPDDDLHRCWVRHGEPPKLTVDKAGDTCQAGQGSIQTDTYHGHLLNGVLTAV